MLPIIVGQVNFDNPFFDVWLLVNFTYYISATKLMLTCVMNFADPHVSYKADTNAFYVMLGKGNCTDFFGKSFHS